MDDTSLDTSPEVQQLYDSLLMNLSGEERLMRCSRMFDAARDMVLASLPEGLPPDELRRRLYQRIYGEPLPPDFPRPQLRGSALV